MSVLMLPSLLARQCMAVITYLELSRVPPHWKHLLLSDPGGSGSSQILIRACQGYLWLRSTGLPPTILSRAGLQESAPWMETPQAEIGHGYYVCYRLSYSLWFTALFVLLSCHVS